MKRLTSRWHSTPKIEKGQFPTEIATHVNERYVPSGFSLIAAADRGLPGVKEKLEPGYRLATGASRFNFDGYDQDSVLAWLGRLSVKNSSTSALDETRANRPRRKPGSLTIDIDNAVER